MDAIFPGQGSQHVGMGKFLFDEFAAAKLVFEEASDALQINVKKLCFDDPQEQLFLTEYTQPALLTTSTALFRVLKANVGFAPQRAAGHSLGEYSALVAAGVLSFADAVLAVRRRGQAMQSAVPVGEGTMLAVLGPSDSDVQRICAFAVEESGKGPLEPANYNSPGQVVISGHIHPANWLRENFDGAKAGVEGRVKFIPLNVSAPFHCSMMKPAEGVMKTYLAGLNFHVPQFDVIANFTAKSTRQTDMIRSNLVYQITGPVRWTQSVLEMKALGSTRFIEVGSGKTLAGLLKKIDGENLKVFTVNSLDELKLVEKEIGT